MKFLRIAEEEKYIPRDQLENELAARASVFEAGMKHRFRTSVHEWAFQFGIDQKKVQEFLKTLLTTVDEQLNEFVNLNEFHVEIESAIPGNDEI